MRRRAFISGLLTTCSTVCASVRRSAAWELVTRGEFKRESTAPHNKAAPAAAQSGAPIITLEEPNLRQRITPPVTLRITFRPQDGATIDPRTFRATYGWLGIDITHHIVANAKVSASGLVANNASVLAGSYRVTLHAGSHIGFPFDHVISVQEVGYFKPHWKTYAKAEEIIGHDRSSILFVANHAFDCIGAKSYGMRTAFIERRKRPFGQTPHQPDLIVANFAELAAALT